VQALQCVAVGEVRDMSLVVVVAAAAAAVVGVDDLIAEHRHSFGLR